MDKALCGNRLPISPKIRTLGLVSLALAWCLFLLLFRTLWTRNFDYSFLIWNLGLVSAPLFFSTLFEFAPNKFSRIVLGALWLLFFPNAPYIITDFVHLRSIHSGPIWLDLLLLASCSGTGVAIAYVSLAQLQDQISKNGSVFGWFIAFASIALSGFGIYLGRFLRWRSVDMAFNPLGLLNDIAERVLHPLTHYRAWGVSMGFATFLFIGYILWRNVSITPRRSIEEL